MMLPDLTVSDAWTKAVAEGRDFTLGLDASTSQTYVWTDGGHWAVARTHYSVASAWVKTQAEDGYQMTMIGDWPMTERRAA
jgi:hypothetical protein